MYTVHCLNHIEYTGFCRKCKYIYLFSNNLILLWDAIWLAKEITI